MIGITSCIAKGVHNPLASEFGEILNQRLSTLSELPEFLFYGRHCGGSWGYDDVSHKIQPFEAQSAMRHKQPIMMMQS